MQNPAIKSKVMHLIENIGKNVNHSSLVDELKDKKDKIADNIPN